MRSNKSLTSRRDFDIKLLSTLKLLNLLQTELQNYGELLSQIFPERVKRLSYLKFSKFWGINVKKLKDRLKAGSYITNDSLMKLKNALNFHLNTKSKFCFQLIDKLERKELKPITFIELLRDKIGRISNLIKVEEREISLLFFGNFNYIKYLKQWITNSKNPQYNPSFKLSINQLEDIKIILKQLLGNNANYLVSTINNYISSNPDLRDYSYQQFTITNPHYFENINTIEKAYWFGFLCADGNVYTNNNKYEISLELSKKDKAELIKFAKLIGFDKLRIRDRTRLVKWSDGNISISEMSIVKFTCKPMGQALIKHGKFGSNSTANNKRIPKIIKNFINRAISKNLDLSKSKSGQLALAWLLGYFDGDGTVFRNRKNQKFSGEIISSTKSLLEDIKTVYMINNNVGFKDKKQCTYRLALGSELYKNMMKTYSNSMQRKRPN